MTGDGAAGSITVEGAAAAPSPQRARGALVIGVRRREDGRTVLARLRQEGCLKARFPRRLHADRLGAVTLNSSGGVASGDVLSVTIEVGGGASATVTAQAAERFYRAPPAGPPARLRTALAVGAGGVLEWLPQDAILFDRAALDRELSVSLAEGAVFLGVERLVFGRAAMGETVHEAWLRDVISVRRGGRLLLHDAIRLQGAVARQLARGAIGGGAHAVGTLLYAAPDAAHRLAPLRDALAAAPGESGASARDGVLLARLVSPDAASLRRAVTAGLASLRDGRMLPREWSC